MKRKVYIGIAITNLGSLIYIFTQSNKLLAFADGIGVVSIISLLISGFIFLEHFGYFDVFGYTFKKTYLVLSNKYLTLESSEKEHYASMYDYIQHKNERRKAPSHQFYYFSLITIVEGIILNIIYIYR